MGDLQKVLERGEYIPLRSAPVFESNFVQVNRRGESIYLHNRPNYVTMGLCASSPSLSLPNVMLLAQATPSSSQADLLTRPACAQRSCSANELVLTRFLPLKFVDLSVHSAKKRRIKLKLVSGRAYYLELCAAPQKQAQLFRQWMRIINLLKSKSKGSSARAQYRDLATQEESRAIRNKALNESNKAESPLSQQISREPMKGQIIKKASSKRVTISDIVGPIEEFRKSQSEATVSSYSSIKKPIVNSEIQATSSQELMEGTIKRNKSRERDSFSHTKRRLQTSAISSATVFPLINLSFPLLL